MTTQALVDHTNNRYNIRVLDRAFRILALLSDGKPRTLQELSGEIGLNTSSTFRQLATLVYYQYVQRNEKTNQYTLGLSCLELARAYYEGNDLRNVAFPELEKLRNETKETVHLAILDQMEIVYIEKHQADLNRLCSLAIEQPIEEPTVDDTPSSQVREVPEHEFPQFA